MAPVEEMLCLKKRRGVSYSRPNSGTDMPSTGRFQARPCGRAFERRPLSESVSFELDSSRSYANFGYGILG